MLLKQQILDCSCLASIYKGSNLSEVVYSIESLFSGSFVPDQIVIVLDGPVDHTILSWLNDWCLKHGSLDLVMLDQNLGLGLALREGLKACRHDIVLRFDTDDINASERLVTCFLALRDNPSLHVLGSFIAEFTPVSPLIARTRLKRVPLSDPQIKRAMNYRNPFNHPSIAFRRAAILSIGSYEHMPFFEDYFLWLKAREAGLYMQNLPTPLVYMRRSSILSRRAGYLYMQAEYNFLLNAFRLGLFSHSFLVFALIRIASRLLPSKLQFFQDYLPWRNASQVSLHPEFAHNIHIF